MLSAFRSVEFLVFLLGVVLGFQVTPARWRVWALLAASLAFYGLLKPWCLLALLASSLVDYAIARWMASNGTPASRKGLLLVGLVNDLGPLAFFKYFASFGLGLVIPIGISYLTLRRIAYLIDVFRQKQEPESNVGRFVLFVSFFPSVIAGPIDRASDLLPQLSGRLATREDDLTAGLRLILWGFFKKVAISDNLAPTVNAVFNNPHDYNGIYLILAALLYSFQIYADFSGYTDIALGAARLFGIRLTRNFNLPYTATSVADFWRRWHISLSTWLRDYIFLPAAYRLSAATRNERILGMRAEVFSYVVAAVSTMTACGLWHGARSTLVLWGALHGACLSISLLTKTARRALTGMLGINRRSVAYTGFQRVVTFLLVSSLWIPFRANGLADAVYIVSHLCAGLGEFLANGISVVRSLTPSGIAALLMGNDFGQGNASLLSAFFGIGILIWAERQTKDGRSPFDLFSGKSLPARLLVYNFTVFWILLFGKLDDTSFIYFQF